MWCVLWLWDQLFVCDCDCVFSIGVHMGLPFNGNCYLSNLESFHKLTLTKNGADWSGKKLSTFLQKNQSKIPTMNLECATEIQSVSIFETSKLSFESRQFL